MQVIDVIWWRFDNLSEVLTGTPSTAKSNRISFIYTEEGVKLETL